MLRTSQVLLTLWAGLNALVALAVTVATLAGQPPPALRLTLTVEQIAALDPTALTVINAQAALANPLILVVCTWVIAAAWKGLHLPWVRTVLAATLLPLQAFGFVSDAYLGGTQLAANGVSTVLLGVGLGLAVVGSRRLARPAS